MPAGASALDLGEIDRIDLSRQELFADRRVAEIFAILRQADPVHFSRASEQGPFWSVTKFDDIVAVDTNHAVFSSSWQNGGIALDDRIINPPVNGGTSIRSFVAQDDPEHARYRAAVQPVVSPASLQRFEKLIGERMAGVLDALPRTEEFDWVERVAAEMAGLLHVTLFNVPLEDRGLLGGWAETILTFEGMPGFRGHAHRVATLEACMDYFGRYRVERAQRPPQFDVISMLAHHPNTRDLSPLDFASQVIALIAAASDTTRSTLSASINAMNRFPAEWEKVRANPRLIPNMVDEVIRWQTPVPHQRRTALRDIELRGKTIRKGDKVAMWYFSGNRDEEIFPDGDCVIADRSNASRQLSFGSGIHRCMGMGIAKLQARKLWEFMIERFAFVEITHPVSTIDSNLSRGYSAIPVRLHHR